MSFILIQHVVLALAALIHNVQAQCPDFNAGFDQNKVVSQAQLLSSHSWEFGTCAEALLELYDADLSVFSSSAFPNGQLPRPDTRIASLSYAMPRISLSGNTLVGSDGAAGDPCSLGVSALLIGQTNGDYYNAAERQKGHILNTVPRFANGAISHRENDIEAWSDFIFMAPPFLAYTAVRDNDLGLMQQAVSQCSLYRGILQPSGSTWQHIVPGPSGTTDRGIWSTGNGWAAMGMARVLATIMHWPNGASNLGQQQNQLTGWIKEIVDGARNAGRDSSGLLRNYLPDNSWFGETSGTALSAQIDLIELIHITAALLAAVVYRMAVLAPGTFTRDYVNWADDSRRAVASHIDSSGILSPAVNPTDWLNRTPFKTGSPEGQSFGAMLYASYRDCVCAGKCS
ncbi:hypothetical protein M409DRAFT_37159 [Zasmidium cellare ATCC 36951]|uniref:Glycoside hydrolase family 105 protein n=1 Tax=Zasmidium cellare ATCC 36951 TaxID=1080233 RepID=A0A6A6CCQ5_ZASCE|nr:uncharacterized protein M409DRAFT_37159 [Zasmidium cellare ATCC 36951]KAF2164010.1 hypothetical protein M409DRAFT_37159 [Zasmidium cellare ATCC 36951]